MKKAFSVLVLLVPVVSGMLLNAEEEIIVEPVLPAPVIFEPITPEPVIPEEVTVEPVGPEPIVERHVIVKPVTPKRLMIKKTRWTPVPQKVLDDIVEQLKVVKERVTDEDIQDRIETVIDEFKSGTVEFDDYQAIVDYLVSHLGNKHAELDTLIENVKEDIT